MRYEVVGLLGRGGSGVVELAVGPSGERVARKRVALHGSGRSIDTAVRRMRREAEVLAALAHPGIIRLLAVEDETDGLVLVMPYLAGGSLHDRVMARGPLPPAEVEALAASLLPALAAAHAAGIVHRDVSPANILFSAEGHPVLADFGIATCRQFTHGLTAAGTVLGTPAYMAPEQARGDAAGPPADLFALGACLHFALTGTSPITGTAAWVEPTTVLGWAATGRRAPLPPSTPVALTRLVDALLDPVAARRPAAVAAIPRAATTVALTVEAAVPVRRRRRWPFLIAAAVLLVGATAAGIEAAVQRRDRTPLVHPDGHFVLAHGAVSGCARGPYHPASCALPPAPHTDGFRCLAPWLDVDAVTGNGCEARPDDIKDGTPFSTDRPRSANLLPAGDVDTFPLAITDEFQWSCDGMVTLRLTAPAGAVRVELRQGATVLGSAVSTDGVPATLQVGEPNCFVDDSGTYTVRVTWAGTTPQRVPGDYTVTTDGSF